ncbi:calcium-responsive transcription factor-like [Clavelina lepadiformis]|uniref:Uncharacterized protein n=1 Tax=Clavelina lepadiformis TaxID=159417 RepID=A0ABP0F7N1_CLALP
MTQTFYEISPGYGYCLSIDDAHATIRAYQEQLQSRFCVSNVKKGFGNIDINEKPRKLFWEDTQKSKVTRECLLFDGVPFYILGKKVFTCEHGRNKNKYQRKQSDKKPTTKKVGCPAMVYMKEVFKFPAYMISQNENILKSNMAEKLRFDISQGKAVGERRFYINFPQVTDHRNHALFYNGKLMRPDEMPNYEEVANATTSTFETTTLEHQPGDGQYCRELIEELMRQTYVSNNEALLQTEEMLKGVLQYVRQKEVIEIEVTCPVVENNIEEDLL